MPSRGGRRCPRCRRTYTDKRCPTCAQRDAAYQADHADDLDRHYQSAAWRATSRAFLAQPWNRLCVLCVKEGPPPGERGPQAAKVADHYPRSRRELVAAGEADPDAFRHLRPLCMWHHRQETNRLQPGGFIKHPERY